jgi:hypothetical protein
VAGREDRAERTHIAPFEDGDGLPDALVLSLDVADSPGIVRLELAAPVTVSRLLERVPLAGVEDQNRQVVRKRHPTVV